MVRIAARRDADAASLWARARFLFLAQGAVVTSFGLALATWMRRLGRAIAASVAAYALVAFGWLICLELGAIPGILSWLELVARDDQDAWRFFTTIEASISPLGAQITPFQSLEWAAALSRYAFYIGHVIVLLFTMGVAFLFLGLTLATFNRSMGRMPERPCRVPRPPRKLKTACPPHIPTVGSREPVLVQASI